MTLVDILVFLQIAAAGALILVGSLVEAGGFGLSLGTSWPYRHDILRLAAGGDPEAWHRVIATLLGLNAIVLAILAHDGNTFSGLAVTAAAGLLGVATLHVLAGKAPSFLHGLHGVLAYLTLSAYLSEALPGQPSLAVVLGRPVPIHAFFLMVLLGGMVTGQRGYRTPIGTFVLPRTGGQWTFAGHLLGWVILVFTLAFSVPARSVAFALALLQGLVGFAVYQSVNASPARPGIVVVLHQGMNLAIFFSLVFAWSFRLSFLG